ncbi:hypothetical protein KVR01_013826 [Diaporthe batatas]|uniref:uncharacterized protein n=1 Tax=Diaporthe batatas TaxID=748121 RepID=UPI001D03C0B8|nr:uncharacterized protein KVR01_013826 [Diaporthe batatas]KAG8156291.1 hypothetical protein KVR01_013826 [Diaporthe batatas]
MTSPITNDWQARGAEKRLRCQTQIPKAWHLPSPLVQGLKHPLESSKNNLIELDIARRSGLLTEKELKITEGYDVQGLLNALASGQLSSLDVTVAFCKRAAIAQQLTSCLTEIFFEQAQERAKHLDALRAKGKIVGPLHGLPISLKDSFQVRGTDATVGFVAYLDNGPSQENSYMVDTLLNLGAVLYCKTNIPQTLMTADSHNNVFGRALNPWNTSLTAGGSTGGEGALIAFRGSPLGVGTDVAGSIRIPALCCGLYGFRPTTCRTPYGKQAPISNPGLRTILPSAGPLANDVGALEIFLKSVINSRPALLDSTVLDVPWRNVRPPKARLRFGVLAEDPLLPLHPPVKKAVSDTADLLRSQGHEIVQLSAQECLTAASYDVATQLFSLDKTSTKILAKAGEPLVPSLVFIRNAMKEVNWDRDFLPDTRTIKDSLERLAFLNVKRSEIQDLWKKMWVARGLDAVIGPGAQTTAVEHDMYALAPYTCLFSFLDYPACVIPVGSVENPSPAENLVKRPGQTVPPYNPANLEGAPTSIQIITTTMRDEECLEIAKLIDTYHAGPGSRNGASSSKL